VLIYQANFLAYRLLISLVNHEYSPIRQKRFFTFLCSRDPVGGELRPVLIDSLLVVGDPPRACRPSFECIAGR
jgi:hypothetical protein